MYSTLNKRSARVDPTPISCRDVKGHAEVPGVFLSLGTQELTWIIHAVEDYLVTCYRKKGGGTNPLGVWGRCHQGVNSVVLSHRELGDVGADW